MYNDPLDPDASSGVDYNFHKEISERVDEVKIAGPYRIQGSLPERAMKRFYVKTTGKRYLKWNLRAIWNASHGVNKLEKSWKPDIVITIFPSTIAYYRGKTPVVFVTDLSFQSWQEHGAGFGNLALKGLVHLEHRAVQKSARTIVHSQWGKNELIKEHGGTPDKINILPMPAALPDEVIPNKIDIEEEKKLTRPLRLLLVGREYHRKGVDIALEVVKVLNDFGLETELIICATDGPDVPNVRYVGPFKKSIPDELRKYANLYRWTHLLIHPARFEPAGIVPGEAAAFGTPTVTNDTGGLATTVKNEVSGIVLPKNSLPESYVLAITELVNDPTRYYSLCRSSRTRYLRELNWNSAGKHTVSILADVTREYSTGHKK